MAAGSGLFLDRKLPTTVSIFFFLNKRLEKEKKKKKQHKQPTMKWKAKTKRRCSAVLRRGWFGVTPSQVGSAGGKRAHTALSSTPLHLKPMAEPLLALSGHRLALMPIGAPSTLGTNAVDLGLSCPQPSLPQQPDQRGDDGTAPSHQSPCLSFPVRTAAAWGSVLKVSLRRLSFFGVMEISPPSGLKTFPIALCWFYIHISIYIYVRELRCAQRPGG